MIKALLLLVDPAGAWDRVVSAKRSVFFILFVSIIPLLAITAAVEGYGMVQYGKWQGGVNYLRKFSMGEAVIFEIGHLLVSLAIVFVGAKIVKSLGETFHGRHSYTQAFTVVAYGLSPMFAARLLDVTNLNPWISWALGVVLITSVLYQGIPRVMQPDPPHAFGLYMTSVILLAMVTGLARFVIVWYIQGRFKLLDSFVANLAGYLFP